MMPYDSMYDEREAMLGTVPYNHAKPPPVTRIKTISNGKKTLGQIAMESDYKAVCGDPRMVKQMYFAKGGHVPKWEDLTAHQQDNWERFALVVLKALTQEFPDVLTQLAEHSKKAPQLQDKVLELPNE